MLTTMLDGGSARSVDLDDAAYDDADTMDDDDDDHDKDDYARWWVCQVPR